MLLPWMMPMLACPRDEVPSGAGWAAEPKLDGWRCCISRGGGVHMPNSPSVRVYSGRNGAEYFGQLPYLEEEVFARLPQQTVIDGELLSPLGREHVASVMRTGRPHEPTADSPALQLYAFDMLMVDNTNVCAQPWENRRALLDGAYFEGADYLRRTLVVPCNEHSLDASLSLGFEGVVCKRMNSPYLSGRRAPSWIKVKPQGDPVDARIVGFKPGKAGGQWDGMVGAFIVELLDTGVRTTVKCGTEKRHREATEHPERWDGVVIEINHHGINKKTGVPLHPQFGCRRDDR